jgi:septum formation protein
VTITPPHPLILASTSRYRRALLERLGLPFECVAPNVDEQRLPNEPAMTYVSRLAEAKARAVGNTHAGIIIGSDQAAVLDHQILGKPGNFDNALHQLRVTSGRTVRFLTGLCVLNTQENRHTTVVVPYDVVFRPLSDAQITRYLQQEQPYDCAGSFKSEGLGIALFERMQGDDPNALIGLPLIALCTLLAREGIQVI